MFNKFTAAAVPCDVSFSDGDGVPRYIGFSAPWPVQFFNVGGRSWRFVLSGSELYNFIIAEINKRGYSVSKLGLFTFPPAVDFYPDNIVFKH